MCDVEVGQKEEGGGRGGGGSLVKEHRSCEVLPHKAKFEWCIFSLLFTQKRK